MISCCTWKASAATTPLSLSKLQVLTKIPRESVDQKEIVWYYHRSCMPKTLQWSKAIELFFLGGTHDWANVWKCFAFPNAWFWNRSWKRKWVKLWGHMTWRPRSRANRVRVVRVWVESVNEIRKKFAKGFECTKSARLFWNSKTWHCTVLSHRSGWLRRSVEGSWLRSLQSQVECCKTSPGCSLIVRSRVDGLDAKLHHH